MGAEQRRQMGDEADGSGAWPRLQNTEARNDANPVEHMH